MPDQPTRPTDAITLLSRTMNPGNGRPTQAVEVSVVRVARSAATSPDATALAQTALEARGVVGNTSAMLFSRYRLYPAGVRPRHRVRWRRRGLPRTRRWWSAHKSAAQKRRRCDDDAAEGETSPSRA